MFAKAVLDKNIEALIVHVSFLSLESIHLNKKAQVASLVTEEVTILNKYSDFVDIFLKQ